MTINHRAIHTLSPWRKARHSSVEMAIKGPDGALNLLRIKGRVGKKWDDYGSVSCVFVWESGEDSGYAFRLKATSTTDVEGVIIPIDKLLAHEQTSSCSQVDIDRYFSSPEFTKFM